MAAASAMMGQPGLAAAAAAAAGNPFLQTPFGMLGTAPRFRWQGVDLLGHLQPGAAAGPAHAHQAAAAAAHAAAVAQQAQQQPGQPAGLAGGDPGLHLQQLQQQQQILQQLQQQQQIQQQLQQLQQQTGIPAVVASSAASIVGQPTFTTTAANGMMEALEQQQLQQQQQQQQQEQQQAQQQQQQAQQQHHAALLQAAQGPGGLVFLPRMTQWFDKLIFVWKFVLRYTLSKSSTPCTTLIFIHEEKKKITSRALFNICFFLLLKFFISICGDGIFRNEKKKSKQLLTTNLAPLQNPVKSIRKEKPNQKRSMFFSKCVQF
jgi:hypothetical protein